MSDAPRKNVYNENAEKEEMRLHCELSPNSQPVPFDYPHFLTGTFHRWMGANELHDGLSLYSLGWLQGGRAGQGALQFPRGASWFISAPDTPDGHQLLERVANAALCSPTVCCGMEVLQIRAEATPDFGVKRTFRANSPILVKGKENEEGQIPHLLWSDPHADEVLTQTCATSWTPPVSGEHSATATMRFLRDYKGAKTRLITIRGIQNRANSCPIIVEGAPEAVQFAWNVGRGEPDRLLFRSLDLRVIMELRAVMRYLLQRKCSCDPKSRRTACRAEVQLPLPSSGLGANRVAGHPLNLFFPWHRPQNQMLVGGANFPQDVFQNRFEFATLRLPRHSIGVNIGDLNQVANARVAQSRFNFLRSAALAVDAIDCRLKFTLRRFALDVFVAPQIAYRNAWQKATQQAKRHLRGKLRGRRQSNFSRERHSGFVNQQDAEANIKSKSHFQNGGDHLVRHLVAVKLFFQRHSQRQSGQTAICIQRLQIRKRRDAKAINFYGPNRLIRRARPIAARIKSNHLFREFK